VEQTVDSARHKPSDYDVILRGGTVIDGSGAAAFMADVGLRGGVVAAVGDLPTANAGHVIDCRDRIIAPGFIDVHTHDDQAVFDTPEMHAKTTQGVTTVVVGNCGVSLAPVRLDAPGIAPLPLLGPPQVFRFDTFAAYRDAVKAAPPAVNVAALVGHATLRQATMKGDLERPATAAEVDAMAALLDDSLHAGAIGLSTGLAYPAALAAPTDEVLSLAHVLKRHRGALYTTHLRNERDHVVEAVKEALRIGHESGVTAVISHHKCIGTRNWGRTTETLPLIDKALKRQDVAMDVYPYTATSTVLLPHFLADADRVLVTYSDPHPEAAARDLSDIAAEWGCSLEEAARRLYPAGAIYFQLSEDDVRRVMRHPRTMIASDGITAKHPHPRLWGTFTKVLGHYVREENVLSLEDAVHRMTGLPASVFGLTGRGTLTEGAAADLVVFDPATVRDGATYETPVAPSNGIDHVLVAGQAVLSNGTPTDARAGHFLARLG
jgi:N-acyl-D-amino-acid deacylase